MRRQVGKFIGKFFLRDGMICPNLYLRHAWREERNRTGAITTNGYEQVKGILRRNSHAPCDLAANISFRKQIRKESN